MFFSDTLIQEDPPLHLVHLFQKETLMEKAFQNQKEANSVALAVVDSLIEEERQNHEKRMIMLDSYRKAILCTISSLKTQDNPISIEILQKMGEQDLE